MKFVIVFWSLKKGTATGLILCGLPHLQKSSSSLSELNQQHWHMAPIRRACRHCKSDVSYALAHKWIYPFSGALCKIWFQPVWFPLSLNVNFHLYSLSHLFGVAYSLLPVPNVSSVLITLFLIIHTFRYARWIEVLRYYNRICRLKPDRLPHNILDWDIANSGKGWINDAKQIATKLHLLLPDYTVLYDLDTDERSLESLSRIEWWADSATKSKLEYFCEFKDREEPTTLVCAYVTRIQQSVLAKSCGILPHKWKLVV